MTKYTAIQRCEALVKALSEATGLDWTFGYVGNLSATYDDRLWSAFAPHPGRVGTHADSIGGVRTEDLDQLPAQLAAALALARVPAVAAQLKRGSL